MNHFLMIGFSILSVLVYLVMTDLNFHRLIDAVFGKVFVIWIRFVFYLKWNPFLPWSRFHINRKADKNSDYKARMLREEFGLPPDE
jgi:hypothetical protein